MFAAKMDNIGNGKEMTINWNPKTIRNKEKVFYTDSNELEIMKRTANAN